MQRAVHLLKHPLRYPEWGECLLAFLGLFQFIFALTVFQELGNRPGYALTVFFSPESWTIAGLLLFSMHIGALRFAETSWGYNARLSAAASSVAFWSHFILSIVLNSMLFGGPFPGTLVPALGTPLLAGAVLYRLWRQY
jgi:hypothetical protein